MKQKGLFDAEVTASDGDELAKARGRLISSQQGMVDVKVLVLAGLLLIGGGYAAYMFLLKKEEPVAPPPAPVKKIPIKGAPVKAAPTMPPGMANVTGVKAAPAKEEAVAAVKKEVKAEAVKHPEVKVGKIEEAAKPKTEIKAGKPVSKEAAKAEIKMPEVKPEAKIEAKPEAKTEAKKTPEVIVSQTEAAKTDEKTTKISKELHNVVVGTYAAKYAAEEAQEKLKGKGIKSTAKEVKKKLTMNRIFIKAVKGKDEVRELISELKGKGYDPFSVISGGGYKVYAVSNMNDDIAKENKADLGKLGYQPVIEKKAVNAKVYELIVRAKSSKEAKTLSTKLKKMGFKPEMRN